MLGHRGCRLAITYPEIYQMQARAIAEAAVEVINKGHKLTPEIMVPLVATEGELKRLKLQIEEEVNRVQARTNCKFEFLIGTMIELPRAALQADKIAEQAQFFSFGTNDLTQTTLGISRDDAGRFLATYVSEGIFAADPFQSIDQNGVGMLVEMASKRAAKLLPRLNWECVGNTEAIQPRSSFFTARAWITSAVRLIAYPSLGLLPLKPRSPIAKRPIKGLRCKCGLICYGWVLIDRKDFSTFGYRPF